MATYIEKLGELREHPNTKGEGNPEPSLIKNNNQKGATTIPEVGVHSSEWKRRASQRDDDIVCSYGKP